MFSNRECKGTGNWTFPCGHGASLMTSVEIGVGEHWRAGVLGCKGGLGKEHSLCLVSEVGLTGADASGIADGTGDAEPRVRISGTLKGGTVLPATAARLCSLSTGRGRLGRDTALRRCVRLSVVSFSGFPDVKYTGPGRVAP